METTNTYFPSVNESKAVNLIKKLREMSAVVTGASTRSHSLREKYDYMAHRLASAVNLSKGPLPARSAHWAEKLSSIIDEAVALMSDAKQLSDYHKCDLKPAPYKMADSDDYYPEDNLGYDE